LGFLADVHSPRSHTVGEFLDEAPQTAGNQQTVEGYAKKFRQIVSEIFDLSVGNEKHDYRQGWASG
jgi:hypothetical protein